MPEEDPGITNLASLFGPYIMLNTEGSSLWSELLPLGDFGAGLGGRERLTQYNGVEAPVGSHTATEAWLGQLPPTGWIAGAGRDSTDYQGGCVAVSHCPSHPAADGALPVLRTQDLANLINIWWRQSASPVSSPPTADFCKLLSPHLPLRCPVYASLCSGIGILKETEYLRDHRTIQ